MRMSAIGPKQTSATALHLSAFGGKADMTFAARRSAFDPTGTLPDTTRSFAVRALAQRVEEARVLNGDGCQVHYRITPPKIHVISLLEWLWQRSSSHMQNI